MVTKICVGDYIGDIYHRAKFYPNWFRAFVSAHAWFRPPRHKVTQLFFLGGWFLRKATSEMRASISTQNTSNDAVPCKEVPFGGRKTYEGSNMSNMRFVEMWDLFSKLIVLTEGAVGLWVAMTVSWIQPRRRQFFESTVNVVDADVFNFCRHIASYKLQQVSECAA